MKTYGIGVVGTGIMGRRMMAALTPHPRFRVTALWDANPEAMAQALADAAGARLADSLEALADDAEVDAIYIATPPLLHLAGVRAAAALAKPVLCEKPLAACVEDAQALRELVVRDGLRFAVNFPFARASAAQHLLQQWQSGALGSLQQASIRLRFAQWPRPWQAGASDWLAGPLQGGFTREVLSHFVFLALRMFGPATVERMQLDRAAGESETRLLARLHHDGVTVEIDAAVAGEVADHNRFALLGSAHSLALSDWYRLEENGQLSERKDPSPGTLDGLAEMLDGKAEHRLATVDEALAVVRIIEALLAD